MTQHATDTDIEGDTDTPPAEDSARELEEHLARHSPEGRPADPTLTPGKIGLLLASMVVVLLTVAIVLALLAQNTAAIIVGVVGLLLFVANPAVWAAVLRARERAETRKKL